MEHYLQDQVMKRLSRLMTRTEVKEFIGIFKIFNIYIYPHKSQLWRGFQDILALIDFLMFLTYFLSLDNAFIYKNLFQLSNKTDFVFRKSCLFYTKI